MPYYLTDSYSSSALTITGDTDPIDPTPAGWDFVYDPGCAEAAGTLTMGRYRVSVATRYFYIDFTDIKYANTYVPGYYGPDFWIKYNAASQTFSYSTNACQVGFTAIDNGATIGVWQIFGFSSPQDQGKLQPTNPSNLSVRKPRWSDHPRVSWTASTPSSAKYKIYRAVNSTTDFSLAYDHYQNTTWDDIGVTVPGALTFYYKVRAESGDQQKLSDGFSNTGSISGDWIQNRPVAIERVPEEYRLQGAYPNPFNPSTRISYELSEAAQVVLSVYNTLGEEIAVLVDGEVGAGIHEVEWDGKDHQGRDVPTGMYFSRIVVGSFTEMKKMILLI